MLEGLHAGRMENTKTTMAATIILSTKLNVAKFFIGVNHFFLFFKVYVKIFEAQSKFRFTGAASI